MSDQKIRVESDFSSNHMNRIEPGFMYRIKCY